MSEADYWTPLEKMIRGSGPPVIEQVVCAWSDLLGFAKPFVSADWRPSPAQWDDIALRLWRAYSSHCRHHMPIGEFTLMLNDGIVRTLQLPSEVASATQNSAPLPQSDNQRPQLTPIDSVEFQVGELSRIQELGLWLKNVVWAHFEVKQMELENGHPGPRTMLAAGERAHYAFPEVRCDDFILNYSRARPGISSFAERIGNPTSVSNPAPLQMNTAVSRAYILDTLGGAHGMSGSRVFVDRSLLRLAQELVVAQGKGLEWVSRRSGGLRQVGVRPRGSAAKDRWVFGFGLTLQPIKVESPTLRTTVFAVDEFYPHDESTSEFFFDLR